MGNIQNLAETEQQVLSTPEEVPVVMSSTPYQPADSPVKEELPPLPVEKIETPVVAKDLDKEIQV